MLSKLNEEGAKAAAAITERLNALPPDKLLAIVTRLEQTLAAVPPSEVREIVDMLRDSATDLKDAVAYFRAAAVNVLEVTGKLKSVLK